MRIFFSIISLFSLATVDSPNGSLELCTRLLTDIYNDPTVYAGCNAGECNANIHRYLVRMNESSPQTITDISVLVIRWSNPNRDLQVTINVLNARGKQDGRHEFYRHTIAVVRDSKGAVHVIDFDFDNGHRVTPIRDYMNEMFETKMHQYLTVWSVPGTDYLTNYAGRAVGETPSEGQSQVWSDYYHRRMKSHPPVTIPEYLDGVQP